MKGMTLIVRNVVGLITAFVMLYGLYVAATGHTSPGGGFTGGVILLAGAVMLVLAYGGQRVRQRAGIGRCRTLSGIAALGFVSVALLGYAFGGFFYNFLPKHADGKHCGGTILLLDFLICVMVATGLTGLLLALIGGKTPAAAWSETGLP